MTIPTPDEICERLRNGGHCREAADLIQQQQATIERLSAALEDAVALIEKQLRQKASAAWDHEAKAFLAALGKDARDLRAREEDRG